MDHSSLKRLPKIWCSFAVLLVMSIAAVACNAQPAAPVIGVVGSGPESMSVRYIMASLHDAGAYPILLDARKPEALEQHLAAVNGVVLAGNSLDINPQDYGAQLQAETKNEDAMPPDAWTASRDDYEYAMIEQVIARKIPFLGICSGMQRLNVANYAQDGGTLVQDIAGQAIWSATQKPHMPALPIRTVEGSRLAAVVAHSRFSDNSLHHQYVDRVRSGFRASAYDETTQIVEAIEPTLDGVYASHPHLLGVQWHPEYGASDASTRLMKNFVQAATKHAAAHPVAIKTAKRQDASPEALRAVIELGRVQLRRSHGYQTPVSLAGENSR